MTDTFNGDCLEHLRTLPSDSLDSLVTDPPAGISFMGKEWDGNKGGRDQWVAWMTEVMAECLRVLKPGAHGLVWAIPRTSHWTMTALENAGFEVKDQIFHLFGSGFPKSLDVRKSAVKQGRVCVCTKNMHDMQQSMGTDNSVSGNAQSDVQPRLCGDASSSSCADSDQKLSDLQSVREAIQTQESDCSEQGENVLAALPGHHSDAGPEDARSTQGDSFEHEGPKATGFAQRRAKPCLEGRRNVQAQQGQLHRAEVRPMPEGLSADGAEGRLHHGASVRDGYASRTLPDQNGSGPSQGPRHAEQRDREPRVVPQQWGSQTCGSCSKPILPEGIGTALKPAVECWVLVRKPCSEKTVAANVLKHGTGGLNIDASRIGTETITTSINTAIKGGNFARADGIGKAQEKSTHVGRFPANLVLDEEAAAALDEQSGTLGRSSGGGMNRDEKSPTSYSFTKRDKVKTVGFGDSGGASRFFYVAKASRSDKGADNTHPTVKSTKLMSYLIRLITPPGGTVLDPFMGSGSTGVAAKAEGFEFVGIEQHEGYYKTALQRIG